MPDPAEMTLHEDTALFREAVNFTASRTGFNPRLIEKDYFCTILLAYLAGHDDDQLVFKGGTCLTKVHAGFYRLSEDLDFAIPLAVDASRTQRRQAVVATKDAVAQLANRLNVFTVIQPLTGANNSTQYNGAVVYESRTTGQPESIRIEVSVREPLLMPTVRMETKTVLLDPIDGNPMVPNITTNSIAIAEAMAEKFRAALSRRDVAIRDYYDLDYAVSHLDLDPVDRCLVGIVRQKLAVPNNPPMDVGAERLANLKRQLDTRLKTVLRNRDFREFDLGRAIRLVTAMAGRLT